MGAATAARPEPASVRHASCSSQQQPAAAKWSVGQPGERRLRAAGAAGSWQDGGQRPRTATRGPPGPGRWAWPAQRGEGAPGGAAARWRGARRQRRRSSQIFNHVPGRPLTAAQASAGLGRTATVRLRSGVLTTLSRSEAQRVAVCRTQARFSIAAGHRV